MNLHQQLNYIIKNLKKGEYNTSEMIEKLDELSAEVRELTFQYQATSVFPQFKEHLKTFTSYGKRNKAKVIATLEDVRCAMGSKKPNNNTMLSQLNRIKKTNFFTTNLQQKMLVDRTVQGKSELQNEIVAVY